MIAPATEAELAQAIRDGQGMRVTGGGTRGMADRSGANGALSTARLSGIRLYEPGALTIVAGAGTPLSEIEAALEAENQMLAFEPMDHRTLLGTSGTPTIGGMAAANVSGPRRIQAGACRDAMLGVRFVDGTGMVVKNGGRVMKNVTGYDLVKLMAGSYGTLGVLTELAFKLLPRPEASATVAIAGLDDTTAVAAMSCALTSPFDVTGAAHLPGEGLTLLRIEGFEESVRYRAARLTDRLRAFGEIAVEEGTDRWTAIRDVAAFAGKPGDVWRVSVKPSDGPQVAAGIDGAEALYDWGGGLVWLRVPEGTDLRAAMRVPGHATLVRGAGRMLHPQPAEVAALEAGLKARFDPAGRLNPGLV